MSTSVTPNLNLKLPNFNSSPWHDDVNENFSAIDATIKSIFGIDSLKGPYKNSTAVLSGERYFDVTTGFYYEAASDFTTLATPNTFAQERTAYPTRWTLLDAAEAIDAASTATTKAAEASTSATNAATSETNAATSETNAATSATNAATSASNAATSATNAANSSTSAAASATNAQTYENAASAAKTSAETAETNAATSATNAATNAATAATDAGTATTKAAEAATSASNAATDATNAATSATNAATSATNAATSETNAAASETNAAASATAAANSAASIDVSALARKDQNLADLTNIGTAKTNLSLENVDNTSDADKPISTAQQTAIDAAALTGGVFQTVQDEKTDTTFVSGGTETTVVSVSITPGSVAHKIKLSGLICLGLTGYYPDVALKVYRDGTQIKLGDAAGSRPQVTLAYSPGGYYVNNLELLFAKAFVLLDEPATTSTITYYIKAVSPTGSSFYINRSYSDTDATDSFRGYSNIILEEIV